jgi:DNA polymerase III alpha subunit
MGLSEDTLRPVVAALGIWSGGPVERHARDRPRPGRPRLVQTMQLIAEIIGFPRHLSQHVGGFVITEGRLDELVPIENATMEDRTVICWDKDDIDALGILKVDVLALGMLTCIRKAFDLIAASPWAAYTLATCRPRTGGL